MQGAELQSDWRWQASPYAVLRPSHVRPAMVGVVQKSLSEQGVALKLWAIGH